VPTSARLLAIEKPSEREGLGRVRMRMIPNAQAYWLEQFVTDVCAPGSTITTDGHAGYRNLTALGYEHICRALTVEDDPAHVILPGVHRIASLLKRWLLGTHQGGYAPQHLDAYLDEFTGAKPTQTGNAASRAEAIHPRVGDGRDRGDHGSTDKRVGFCSIGRDTGGVHPNRTGASSAARRALDQVPEEPERDQRQAHEGERETPTRHASDDDSDATAYPHHRRAKQHPHALPWLPGDPDGPAATLRD
jgi:ISXO2-like transposase domain